MVKKRERVCIEWHHQGRNLGQKANSSLAENDQKGHPNTAGLAEDILNCITM